MRCRSAKDELKWVKLNIDQSDTQITLVSNIPARMGIRRGMVGSVKKPPLARGLFHHGIFNG